jgi:hypothetical protein
MSTQPTVAPYGEWVSPITAELVAGSNNVFNEVHVDVRCALLLASSIAALH